MYEVNKYQSELLNSNKKKDPHTTLLCDCRPAGIKYSWVQVMDWHTLLCHKSKTSAVAMVSQQMFFVFVEHLFSNRALWEWECIFTGHYPDNFSCYLS